jgi:hypothetical protein
MYSSKGTLGSLIVLYLSETFERCVATLTTQPDPDFVSYPW